MNYEITFTYNINYDRYLPIVNFTMIDNLEISAVINSKQSNNLSRFISLHVNLPGIK